MEKAKPKAPKVKKEQPEKKHRIEHLLNIAKYMHSKGNEVDLSDPRVWSSFTLRT